MLKIVLLLSNIFDINEATVADSMLLTTVDQASNQMIEKNESINWGFILFFICFFIIVSIISNRNKFLLSMFGRLFRNKDRHSMFYEAVTHETLNKFLLSFQTVILLSIILYCVAIHEQLTVVSSLTQMLLFIGKCALVFIGFFLYKFFIYSILGAIFFKKETVFQWNDDFFSLICLNGIFLFIPVLILFYVEPVYPFLIYFLLFYLFLNLIFIFYKIYALFFQGKQRLLYFILYLCTQEIIPLYLVYRGFIYLITQKDTIWM